MMQSSKGAMTFTVMRDSLRMRRRFVIQGLRRGGLVAVGLMGLLVGPGVVRAEGGCPAGHYPIGGQGVQGCAPITAASAPVSRPNGKWIKTWGALVYSNSTGDTGVATGKTSKSAAVEEALANCRGGGPGKTLRKIASILPGPGVQLLMRPAVSLSDEHMHGACTSSS